MRLTIEGTKTTPYVQLTDGHIEIRGRSVPFAEVNFYNQLFRNLKRYSINPSNETKIDIHLSAANAYSKRSIFRVLRLLEELSIGGKKIIINWYYDREDEDMRDLGKLFRSMVKLDLRLMPRN
jgi:hypothetical protein